MIDGALSSVAVIDEFDTRSVDDDDFARTAQNIRMGMRRGDVVGIGHEGAPDDVAVNVLVQAGCGGLDAQKLLPCAGGEVQEVFLLGSRRDFRRR